MIVNILEARRYAVNMKVLSEEAFLFFLENFGCARKVYNLYVDHLYGFLEKSGFWDGATPDMILPEVSSFKTSYNRSRV